MPPSNHNPDPLAASAPPSANNDGQFNRIAASAPQDDSKAASVADLPAPNPESMGPGPARGASEVPPGRLGAMFRSLRYRDFALFWTGNFLSNIGTWMQNLALGWQILLMTNSPFLLGLNGFLGTLPALIFSLPGGAIADRLNRRKLMLTTQSSMAATALILALLTSFHAVKINEILLLSFLTGLAGALNSPVYQALVPDLVPRHDLVNAISLNSAQFNMSRALGPTLAGLALGTLGVAGCYYLNSLSFFALILALVILKLPPRTGTGPDLNLWGAVLDGLRFVNRYRLLIILLSVPTFLSLFGLPFIVLMPVFARDLLHVGATGLGYLMAGAGLGAVMSALGLASQRSAQRRGGFILTSASLFGLALLLLAQARTFWWSFFLLVALGASMVGATALTNTTLQMVSPPELRGRIMSFYVFTLMGLAPLGSLWVGHVAEQLGTRFALTLGGTVCLIYFVTVRLSLPHLRKIAHLPWPDHMAFKATVESGAVSSRQ